MTRDGGRAWFAGMLPLEGTLLEKLRRIEALYAGTKVDGEREAAQLAAERIRARLAELRGREHDEELIYSLPDPWKRRLFLALCRRYGIKPFRESGRRYSTVRGARSADVPKEDAVAGVSRAPTATRPS
jgi:hypothetical protein